MYSVAPLSESGPLLGYIFFFVVFVVVWAFYHLMEWSMNDYYRFSIGRGTIAFFGVYFFFAGLIWFISPPHVSPRNEKVYADQVGEGGQMESTGGKHPRSYYQMYVFYQTPDGIIAIRRSEGKIYPQRAILYKN